MSGSLSEFEFFVEVNPYLAAWIFIGRVGNFVAPSAGGGGQI